MKENEFNSFFEQHSKNVDNSDSLGFWRLTDQIIETFLLDNIKNRENVTVVDFGGGTGRWFAKLDQYFENSNFVIVDKSPDMLSEAKKKIDNSVFSNAVSVVVSDIENVKVIDSSSVDYVISTYNPLSFTENPQNVIDEAYRILKVGGCALVTVQGYHNALYSKLNNFQAGAQELDEIFTQKKVKWNDYVPALWQLSANDMKEMFVKSGFTDIAARGVACIIQPQNEDFDPQNSKLGEISKRLNTDKKYYEAVLKIELETGRQEINANRGMNIMTIGVKD